MATQLSFFPDVDEKEVRSVVVKELKKYKALKVQMENKKEQCENGIEGDLFPKLIDNDLKNQLKVIQIERALENSLDYVERKIIVCKYLNSIEINDIDIFLDLGIKKGKYYLKKRTAIYNLATALGII